MTKKFYTDYFQDILNSINEVEEFAKGMTYEEFPHIPWRKMAGMRDKLIHEYFGVDLGIIWEVTQTDLPSLEPLIAEALQDIETRERG